MSDWKIHRREERCSACERAFDEGETFFSLLAFEGEGLRREDRCSACFEAPSEEAQETVYWRTRHSPDRRARFAVDFEAIEELFLALEGRARGRLAELRYLLALLLMRKKRLKLIGVRRSSEGETLRLRRPRRTEELEVAVFDLDAERSASLKAELARVFEGAGLEALLSGEGPAEPRADPAGSPAAEAAGGA